MDGLTAQGLPRWVTYCEGLLEGLSAALLIANAEGRIVYANSAAAAVFGAPVDNLVGSTIDDERLLGRHGWPASAATGGSAGREESPFASALRLGQPVYGVELELERTSGTHHLSLDSIPLESEHGRVAGVGLVYHDLTEPHARAVEVAWMQKELVRTRREVEEALQLSAVLNLINELVHSTLRFDVIIARVIEQATRALGAEKASVEVCEDGAWAWRVVHRMPAGLAGRRIDAEESVHAEIVAETRMPLTVPDVSADGRFWALQERYGIRSLLAVPLISRGTVVGSLSFHNSWPGYFSYQQIGFASKVASTVSLASENARLYAEEHHIADVLQHALLVVPDAVRGLEFEHLYQSATEAAWVGGDFFDVFELADSRTGIVIGDVSGKGVEASALASFTRQLIKAHSLEEVSPAVVIARANDLVFRVSGRDDFITVFFGILDPDGTLTYCSAGHPSPVIQRPGEPAMLLEDGSPIIGAWDELEYRDSVARMEDDAMLVLYTDGVIEARRDGELFGEPRLLSVLRSLADTPPSEVPGAILAEIDRFSGGSLRDDVAILVCRRARPDATSGS